MKKKLLTTKQAAKYLGTTQNALYQKTHYKIIPFIKLGPKKNSAIRFNTADLDKWLKSKKHKNSIGY